MGRRCGRTEPDPCSGSCGADVVRASEVQHPVQHAGSACHDAITPEALAGLSPYQTEHVNRFGNYVLDLTTPPAPLPFDLPARARPPGPTAPSEADV